MYLYYSVRYFSLWCCYTCRFHRSYPFPSFNVKDLHTVDRGVKEHLLPEISRSDWTVVIGHFLGVDHCGHRYGPSHPAMSEKLQEMDDVIRYEMIGKCIMSISIKLFLFPFRATWSALVSLDHTSLIELSNLISATERKALNCNVNELRRFSPVGILIYIVLDTHG